MKIVFVGASGFIGTNLINQFKEGDHDLLNVDKVISKSHPSISVQADVTSKEQLSAAIPSADWLVLLAAEHTDNVSPVSLYYDVNVTGTKNVLAEMDKKGIKKIVFTSTVAIYGLNKENPDESHPASPFNHYGKSKWEAEEVLRQWYEQNPAERTLIIIRPTVVFGPRNRGNVYNLLRQIASGRFLMIGKGENKKSMAYVENIAGFIKYAVEANFSSYHIFNYSDKPDLSTKELVEQAEISLGKKVAPIRVPYIVGYAGGLCFDIVAKISGKKFPISAVRIKKFCATTQFSANKMQQSGYNPAFSLQQGLDRTIKSILEDQHQ